MFDWEASEGLIEVMAGRQTVQVVAALADQPMRFNALAWTTGLDHKSLDRRLCRLEHSGIVDRAVQIRPLQVKYRLTPEAVELIPTLAALAQWWRSTPG